MTILKFSLFLEKLSLDELNRKNKSKIDLSQVDVVYHWLTEGKLFDACYGYETIGEKYILKKGKMPELLPTKYELKGKRAFIGTPQICLTVDPLYFEPAFNEDGSCIIFDFNKLKKEYKIQDLTDNNEAEIRILDDIIDWQKYVIQIDIGKKSYLTGQGWEDFRFRAIKEWLPEELKSKVVTFTSLKQLMNSRKTVLNENANAKPIPDPTHICVKTIPSINYNDNEWNSEMKVGTLLFLNDSQNRYYEVPDYDYKSHDDRHIAWFHGKYWMPRKIESDQIYKLSPGEVNVIKKEGVKKLLSIILPSIKFNI